MLDNIFFLLKIGVNVAVQEEEEELAAPSPTVNESLKSNFPEITGKG
jgi:hypothetical protein